MKPIKLTEYETDMLNQHVNNPFITYAELNAMYNRGDRFANNIISRIAKRNRLQSRQIRLHLFTALGWIQTQADYSKIFYKELGRNNQHEIVLDYLVEKPYATNDEIAIHTYFSRSHVGKIQCHLYNANVGRNDKSSQKLRLFHKLGWYRPFKLTANM